jgi:uncharacterized membrane protein YjgN (DUF898 family)
LPLSPYEVKVLATIEKELRDEDPELAAALSRTSSPSFSAFLSPVSIRHVLLLIGALISLVAISTVFAEQLGFVGLAVLTCVAVVPWLVTTVRSAELRSRTAGGTSRKPSKVDRNEHGRAGNAVLFAAKRGALLAAVSVLVALALMPHAWQAILAFGLTLVMAACLPWLIVRGVERFERSSSSPRRGTSGSDPK